MGVEAAEEEGVSASSPVNFQWSNRQDHMRLGLVQHENIAPPELSPCIALRFSPLDLAFPSRQQPFSSYLCSCFSLGQQLLPSLGA